MWNWNIKPIKFLLNNDLKYFFIFSLFILSCPLYSLSIKPNMLSKEVFPDPDGPKIDTISLVFKEKFNESNILLSLYFFVISIASSNFINLNNLAYL